MMDMGRYFKNKDGTPLIPNHHPHCPHYNDSLMDVWKVSDGASDYYVDNESDAIYAKEDEARGRATITQEKMHREIFENLPEFDGF
jgi:hypothetical protein